MKTSPPLLAHVVFRFGVGGLENGIVNLINHLPRERWRHAIVSLTDVSHAFTERIIRPDVNYAGTFDWRVGRDGRLVPGAGASPHRCVHSSSTPGETRVEGFGR